MSTQDVALSEERIIKANHLNNYMTEGLGEVERLSSAFLENGFKNVTLNRQQCELLKKSSSNSIFSYKNTNNELYVWINN